MPVTEPKIVTYSEVPNITQKEEYATSVTVWGTISQPLPENVYWVFKTCTDKVERD
jgi:hypothetical protein